MELPLLTTLGERLRVERQRGFVGRSAELSTFTGALSDETCSLFFVTGRVGVGKSALLQELQRVATIAGHPTTRIDASLLVDSPALALPLLKEQVAASTHERGDELSGRRVVFVDALDRLGAHGEWLFTEIVEMLAADALLVVASRRPLPSPLALDSAWSRLLVQVELQPFAAAEAEAFLESREVPSDAHAAISELSRGFPLALAAAASMLGSSTQPGLTVEGLREVQHTLASMLCPGHVTYSQQLALDVCAVAHTTSAELLEAMRVALGVDLQLEGQDLFNWLSEQSFVSWSPNGLEPHLLLRVALQAQLRRDRPRRFQALSRALREFLVAELATATNPDANLLSLFFLDRDVPMAQRWLQVDHAAVQQLDPARPSDAHQILQLIRRMEGEESAALMADYLQRERDHFDVVRDDVVTGVLHHTRLDAKQAQRLEGRDPVSSLVRGFVADHPLEADEEAILFRWFVDGRDYQAPSPRVLALTGRQTQLILSAKQLAYSFCVFRTPSDWVTLWKDINVPWQLVGRFNVGHYEYSLLVFMWRSRTLRDVLLNAWRKPESNDVVSEEKLALDELRVKVAERVLKLAQRIKLTPREVEILEQLCLGHSFEDIARNLSIRPRTVKFHQENLLRKTGAASRVELFRKLL